MILLFSRGCAPPDSAISWELRIFCRDGIPRRGVGVTNTVNIYRCCVVSVKEHRYVIMRFANRTRVRFCDAGLNGNEGRGMGKLFALHNMKGCTWLCGEEGRHAAESANGQYRIVFAQECGVLCAFPLSPPLIFPHPVRMSIALLASTIPLCSKRENKIPMINGDNVVKIFGPNIKEAAPMVYPTNRGVCA